MSESSLVTVSVIIPVYNGAQFIKAAIESVLAQTYKDVEIIVIDDGSTDDTKRVVEPYLQAGKIKYIYQVNRGLSAARNAGVKAASGKYLKFLDCDDFLYPKQLELQVAHLTGKKNIISLADYALCFENGKEKINKIRLVDKSRQLARLIMGNFMPVHTILVETDAVIQAGGFDEELTSLEDADLWLRLLLKGVRIEKVDYVGCGYRIVDNSLSSKVDKMFFMRCKTSEKLNTAMLSMLSQVDKVMAEALLAKNAKLITGCFARRLEPEQYLSKTLACTQILFLRHKNGLRKLFFQSIGGQRYMRLKYQFNCLRIRNYRNSLLSGAVEWRKSE